MVCDIPKKFCIMQLKHRVSAVGFAFVLRWKTNLVDSDTDLAGGGGEVWGRGVVQEIRFAPKDGSRVGFRNVEPDRRWIKPKEGGLLWGTEWRLSSRYSVSLHCSQ